MNEMPKYYLADVPQDLRRRVLDLCCKMLWHEALELLQQHGFNHYSQDEVINFYCWAPTYLPEPAAAAVPSSDVGDHGSEQEQKRLTTDYGQATASMDSGIDGRSPASDDGRVPTRGQPVRAAMEPNSTSSTQSSKNPSIQQSKNPDSHALLNDLRDLIKRYVVLPELSAEALALWVVHTYAFTLREVTTYIGVVSPEKRCGKTTLLELLRALAHESVAAANISPPALFRVIQETQPTLIIDEADTFLHARDEMAGILNAGYRKSTSYVVRVGERKRAAGLARFSCWCPKVMAAIGRLPDTLADRCIVITMQRKMPGEKCERMRNLDATEYRTRCAAFVREHSDAIARAQPEIPATLNDRAADIWEPLLVIADLAGGQWPELARQAARKLSAYEDETTLVGHFLQDLRNWMLFKKVDRMLSRDIVATFNPAHDRPWEDLRRGREINEWWLSQRMKEFGIRPRAFRVGKLVGKGYLLGDIEATCRRYAPDTNTDNSQASSVGGQTDEDDEDDYSGP